MHGSVSRELEHVVVADIQLPVWALEKATGQIINESIGHHDTLSCSDLSGSTEQFEVYSLNCRPGHADFKLCMYSLERNSSPSCLS